MSEEKWLEAARAYEQKSKEVLQAPQTATATAVAPRPVGSSVSEIAYALTKFILSEEGTAAKQLLYASKKYIQLGVECDGEKDVVVYFMDYQGYKQSVTDTIAWLVYINDVPKPNECMISEAYLAEGLVSASMGQTTVEHVLATLKNKLNAIAQKANE